MGATVAVRVGVHVAGRVGIEVGVGVGVLTGVRVRVGGWDTVGLAVTVGVGDDVGRAVGVSDGDPEGSGDLVGVRVFVGVAGVFVGVAVPVVKCAERVAVANCGGKTPLVGTIATSVLSRGSVIASPLDSETTSETVMTKIR